MKKVSVLFSLLLVFALALSACASPGDEDTGELEATGTLDILEPTDVLGVGATSTPLATATEDAGAGGAGGLATATLPAVTAEVTEVMTGTAEALEEPDLSRLAVLLGTTIQDANGEDIGEVENVVLDFCNAQATYLVAGFGGFLNIGEKEVGIPWESFQVTETDLDGDGDVDRGLTLNLTEEQLENAPDFETEGIDLDAPDWDDEIRNFWETQIEGAGTVTGTTDAETQPTAEVQATEAVTGTTGAEGAVTADRCAVMGENFLDLPVMIAAAGTGETGTPAAGAAGTATPAAGGAEATGIPAGGVDTTAQPRGDVDANEEIGGVEDVILNPTTGELQWAVVSVDTEDLDGNWVLVPPRAFHLVDMDADDDDLFPDALVLHVSAEDLAAAPNFDPDALPDTSVEGWDVDIDTYWTGVDIDVEP